MEKTKRPGEPRRDLWEFEVTLRPYIPRDCGKRQKIVHSAQGSELEAQYTSICDRTRIHDVESIPRSASAEVSLSSFRIVDLPAEIRMMIYDQLLGPSELRLHSKGRLPRSLYGDNKYPNIRLPFKEINHVRPLLATNRRLQKELAARIFEVGLFDLASCGKPRKTIKTAVTMLTTIGRFGRDNIRQIAIRWWDTSWCAVNSANPAKRKRTKTKGASRRLSSLLENCPNLKALEVVMPFERSTNSIPEKFKARYALYVLRSISLPHVAKVKVLSGDEDFNEWVLEGVKTCAESVTV